MNKLFLATGSLRLSGFALVLSMVLATQRPSYALEASGGFTPATQDLDRELKEIIEWLPADTETLILARGPFTPSIDQPPEGEDHFLLFRMWPVAFALQGDTEGYLKNREVLVALEGSRYFSSPKGLGLQPFDGCQVVRFKEPLSDKGPSYLDALKARASDVERIGDLEVPVLREESEADIWTYFYCHPKPDLLLVATSRAYLSKVLERMSQKDRKSRALPKDLPEWKEIDVKSPIWAIRHFDRRGASTDPSSPIPFEGDTRERKAVAVIDDKAIGLAFSYDPEKDRPLRLRYLSAHPKAAEIAAKAWDIPHENLKCEAKLVKRHVVDIRFGEEELKNPTLSFALLCYLGHSIAL